MTAVRLPPVTRVGVLARADLHAAVPHLLQIAGWLQSRRAEVVFETDTAALLPRSPERRVVDRAALATDVDMVLVLGGDGTLIGMADRIGEAASRVPILGVNFGGLGFLTEVPLPELFASLEAALTGEAHVEERMMLHGTIMRAGQAASQHVVLNDAVITKALSRMMFLSVWVGDEFVTNVKADGLIVATPTGSTAYNLAAGGPIVQPAVEAILLTPIAPHTLTNRPIVIPATAAVRVQPAIDGRGDVFVTFDGRQGHALQEGDEVVVRRADETIRLIKPKTRSYFEVLRTKLKWGER
jgi:NAD+ kinase